MDKERTCFECVNYILCFLRHRLEKVFDGCFSGMINIDGDSAPEGYQIVHSALANCCCEFKKKDEVKK